jgi:hypothetical protein
METEVLWPLLNSIVAVLNVGVAIHYAARYRSIKRYEADLDMDVAAFKNKLDSDKEKAIELLRVELRSIAFEREIMLSNLQERRINICAELYGFLSETLIQLQDLVSPFGDPSSEEKIEQAKSFFASYKQLWLYFQKHRVWFEEPTCRKIDFTLHPMYKAFIRYGIMASNLRTPNYSSDNDWEKAANTASEEIPKLLSDVENDFRALLGVKLTASMAGNAAQAITQQHYK